VADDIKQQALDYHRIPRPGKLQIAPSKPLDSQHDLALAYSPGVAFPCIEIEKNPATAALYTGRSNLVGVITNGTAVLGLGAIGSLASKPVMEGKAVLFKAFADIDVFDIEVDELDAQKFIDTVASLEPTFGGINLEDIKAPECFIIEEALKKRMKIPVFHDDQHGTAVVVAAAVYNGLRLTDKRIEEVKVVTSGAGAAAQACLNLLISMGLKRENIIVCDGEGVIYKGRSKRMNPYKSRFAVETDARTLQQALVGADILLGLSVAGIVEADWLMTMARAPLILTLANPIPEIMPEVAKAARPDALIATGRSDYPNQVNNVLCFPFLFRGALDVGATEINSEMKLAAVRAIADLVLKEENCNIEVEQDEDFIHAPIIPCKLIPSPFNPLLLEQVAGAVAQAAIESGVATRPFKSLKSYQLSLQELIQKSGLSQNANTVG